MEKIRELREISSLTQKELATALNTSNKNIWAYENDIANPSFEMLVKIADYFNVTTDYLLGREDDFGNVATSTAPTLSTQEQRLLVAFRSLDERRQNQLVDDAEYYAKKKVKV